MEFLNFVARQNTMISLTEQNSETSWSPFTPGQFLAPICAIFRGTFSSIFTFAEEETERKKIEQLGTRDDYNLELIWAAVCFIQKRN
jgi:hypothetical protein